MIFRVQSPIKIKECDKMTDFTKIRSDFVKGKLKGFRFNEKNKLYIEDLMRIEKLVSGKTLGLGTGHIRMHLKDKYPQEWEAIRADLAPEKMSLDEERSKERAEEEKSDKELGEEERKEREESERTWKEMNGCS